MPAAATSGTTPLNITIRITTTGVGTATRGMSAVTRGSTRMGTALTGSVISARTLGDAMRQTATLMKYTVAGAFINIGKQAIQMQRQFELSFSRIKGLVVVTGDSLDQMRERVMSLAGETTRAPVELADALYYITSAGIKDTVTALEVLESSAKAAAAGLGDTNTVADAVTSTMNAYGAQIYSAAKVTDILVATVREGKAEADTFAPALGKVLPVAAAYGASFEDVSAAIAALSRGGLSAGTAAIYVRQTLSQLLKPSKQATEVLKGVGTSAEEIRQNVREKGLFPALLELRNQLGGIENAADFTKVFGNVRALTAVLSLVGPAAEDNAQIFERMNDSFGDLDVAFDAYAGTIDAQFNRALAEQQAALIEVGEAIKPIVKDLLSLGTAIAKGFRSLFGNDIGAIFIRIAAGATIAVAAFSTVLKTSSALVRLFSNLQISLFGTQLKYDAATGAVYRYVTGTVTAGTATGGVTKAIGMWIPANGFLATSLLKVGAAMRFVTSSLGIIIPVVSTILILIPLVKAGFSKMFSKEPPKTFASEVAKANEILNETAKYARSGINFEVNFSLSDANRQAAIDKARSDLEQAAPDFLPDFRKYVTDNGTEVGAAYIKSLLATKYAGNTDAFKQTITDLLLQEGAIDPKTFAKTLIPEITGDAVADAISFQGLVDAAQVELDKSDFMLNFDPAVEGTQGFFKRLVDVAGRYADYYAEEGAAYGQAFTEGLQKTQQLNPLIANLRVLGKEFDAAGVNASKQGQILQSIVGPAFEGLSDKYDLVGDKTNALRNLFMKTNNQIAAIDFIKSTFNIESENEAKKVLNTLRLGMKGIPDDATGAKKALDVFVGVLDQEALKATKKLDSELQTLDGTLSDVSERFSQGLHPTIQGFVSDFDAATAALKEFERGQEAVMGFSKSMTEAQIEHRDTLRDLAKAGRESAGDLFGGTKAADDSKEAMLDAMQGVLGVVNNFAMQGQDDQAASAFGEGYARIVAMGIQSGFKQEDILKFFDMHQFNATMLDSLAGAQDAAGANAEKVADRAMEGLKKGIENGRPMIVQAVAGASDTLIEELKKRLEVKSPSRKTAREIGKPAAEGVAKGFGDGMKIYSKVMGKDLRDSINNAYKQGGRKGASKFFKTFLDKKGDVETPAMDFVKETISRMKDIIGSLGGYIKSQLNFRKSQADLAKLINMQKGLDDRKKKAAREQQYAETRFGRGGGAEVTGYEQARLDELQFEFERVSRDYAMGRATYTQLVDAEIALYEARAAANEINDEVIDSQNNFIDATVDVENKQLELAAATVNVLSAYQDVQEAAFELYINHAELEKVYTSLATATGIASGQLVVGSKDLTNLGSDVQKLGGFTSTVGGYVTTLGINLDLTKSKWDMSLDGPDGVFKNIIDIGGNVNSMTKAIGADFTNLASGLLDKESQMWKDLNSLGPEIFKAIRTSAQESLDKSPLNLKVSVNAIVSTSGGSKQDDTKDIPPLGGTPPTVTIQGPSRAAGGRIITTRAVGGPVTADAPYFVGERGPEMFVPNVSGTIVTNSALERYTRTRPTNIGTQQAGPSNNIVVTVNNPVPQAAEDSITRRMKVLSNSGLFG